MKHRERMSSLKINIILGCFIAYVGAYLCRLNLSAALPQITEALALTGTQAGLLPTMFAVPYAAGQLLNGMVADRVNARRHMVLGLAVSAALNAVLSLCESYPLMLVLWALNGMAQSMLWAPIVKLISGWFDDVQRKRVTFILSFSLIVGHVLAWGLAGFMAANVGWRMSFLLPALIAAACVAATLVLLRGASATVRMESKRKDSAIMPIDAFFIKRGMLFMLMCCVCNGFVRDSVMNWAPSLLSGSGELLPLLIPAVNLIGILLGRALLSALRGSTRLSTAAIMLLGAVLSLILLLGSSLSAAVCALLLGLACAAMYACNPMLTAIWPMEYASVGRVCLCAGIADCCLYAGSALSGVLVGALRDAGGAGAMYSAWLIALVAGMIGCLVSARLMKMGK